MKPFLEDSDLTVYCGDVLDVLRELPDASANCVVTSPPYWGLRDYGVEGQLGLEASLPEFLANMVEVFSEVRRVLAADGTLWLNMGDSYGSGNRGNYAPDFAEGREHDRRPKNQRDKQLIGVPWRLAIALMDAGWNLRADCIWAKPNPMPESVRDRPTKSHEYVFMFSKQRRYYFDQEAVREAFSAKTRGNWSQSHHAESEKLGRAGTYRREYRHPELDAPAQAETLYDADPLAEDPGPSDGGRQRAARAGDDRFVGREYGYHEDGRDGRFQGGSGGDVAPTPPAPTLEGLEEFAPDPDAPSYVVPDGWATGPGAHDAVSHSTREREFRGGGYWVHQHQGETQSNKGTQETLGDLPPEAARGPDGRRQTRRVVGDASHENHQNANGRERWPKAEGRNMRTVWTIPLEGYPGAHFATFPRELARRCIAAGTREGDVVLDPFGGSGTTGEVARKMGRRAVLIELDLESCELIRERTQQLSLLAADG